MIESPLGNIDPKDPMARFSRNRQKGSDRSLLPLVHWQCWQPSVLYEDCQRRRLPRTLLRRLPRLSYLFSSSYYEDCQDCQTWSSRRRLPRTLPSAFSLATFVGNFRQFPCPVPIQKVIASAFNVKFRLCPIQCPVGYSGLCCFPLNLFLLDW